VYSFYFFNKDLFLIQQQQNKAQANRIKRNKIYIYIFI